jgi:hypothetical protein
MKKFGTARLDPLNIAMKEGSGALWFNRKIRVAPRFEAKIYYTINDGGCNDPGSWAFDGVTAMISKTTDYLLGSGGSMGYDSMYDAIVTEIDLYDNPEIGDLSDNALSVHKCFRQNCLPNEGTNTVQRELPYVNFF